MRKQWIFAGTVVVALLAATAGIAYAAGSGGEDASGYGNMSVDRQAAVACDAMHDSTVMQATHDQMPVALQAQCDAMHEQMGDMMGGSGMMDGSGMMGGSGMMDGGSMASHHPAQGG